MPAKKNIIDLDTLDPETRSKVERIIAPLDKMATYKFNPDDIALWRAVSNKSEFEDMTSWMRHVLNEAATDPLPDHRSETRKLYDAQHRTVQLSRRFSTCEFDRWLQTAGEESMTSWVERHLNAAAGKKKHS